VLSVLFLDTPGKAVLFLSSLVLSLDGPELAGVCSVLLVLVLDIRGVLGLDVGRAAARALNSAKGSSSLSFTVFSPLDAFAAERAVVVVDIGAATDAVDAGTASSEGMSSN